MGRHSIPDDDTRDFVMPYQPRHAAPTDWDLTQWVTALRPTTAPQSTTWTARVPHADDTPTQDLAKRPSRWPLIGAIGLLLIALAAFIIL